MLKPRISSLLQHQARKQKLSLALPQYSLHSCPYATVAKSVGGQPELVVHKLQPQSTAHVAHDGLWRLKTSVLIRNILLGWVFSSPRLVKTGTKLLDRVARSKSTLLNPDMNALLRSILKPLLYSQFCAGTTKKEIAETRNSMLSVGYAGIILAYGKECDSSYGQSSDAGRNHVELKHWRDGNLETLDMIGPQDFLAVKYTGAGKKVTQAMIDNEDPPADLRQAMDDICRKAESRGCRLWIDAEYHNIQSCIDRWTIDFMRRHNRERALIYNTIQAYLKSSRDTVRNHLELASKGGWHLGIKLVRGAYIGHDPRVLIHDTKKDTDTSYNGIAHDLLSGSVLAFELPQGEFPKLSLFLAGHNPESISMAWDLTKRLKQAGTLEVVPDFGQLQGMGDHISCSLLQQVESAAKEQETPGKAIVVPRIYKSSVWGSVQECMMYLVRRAHENSSGTDRIKDGISAYSNELRRRLIGRKI